MEKNERKNLIKKLIWSSIGLAIFLLLVYIVLKKLGLTQISQSEMQEAISSTGAIAPLIFILVTFLQVTFIPIPSTIPIIVGSYLFGPILAFIYSYIGLMVGSIVAFYLGKALGRPFINWLSGGKEETDKWMKKLHGKEKILLFFMFLFPVFPDDLLCSIAGILPINFPTFLIMQVLTRATTVGCTLLFMSGEVIPFNAWGISLIVLAVIFCFFAFIYCFRNADKINDYFSKMYNKVFKKEETKNK